MRPARHLLFAKPVASDAILLPDAIDEFCDRRFRSTVRNDLNVETVVAVQVKRSFDRAGDPLIAVAEDTAAKQREIDDSVAGAGRVGPGGGQL